MLSLTVVAAQPAVALNSGVLNPPLTQAERQTSKILIKDGLKGIGSRFAVRAGAGAAADVACGPGAPICLAATTAVAAGLVAYDTKDIWMPWVNDLFSKGTTLAPIPTGTITGDYPPCGTYASASAYGTTGIRVVVGRTAGCSNYGPEIVVNNGQPFPCRATNPGSGDARCGVGVDQFVTGGQCKDTVTGETNAGIYATDENSIHSIGTVYGQAFERTFDIAVCPPTNSLGHTQTMVFAKAFVYDQGWNIGLKIGASEVTPPWPESQNTQTTTVECKNMSTNTLSTISDTVVGRVDGYNLPSCSRLGDNWFPNKTTVAVGPDTGHQTPQFSIMPDPTFYTDYADCFVGGVFTCVVRVYIDGQRCTSEREVCHNWDQYRKDNPDIEASCRAGTHKLPWGDCAALRWAYDPQTSTAARTVDQTKTDGSPLIGTATAPDLVTQENPNADPSTGTGTGVIPETGTNPSTPGAAVDGSTDPDSTNCYGTGWSWNPVSWVVIPVKCSLLWAFKPPPGYLDAKQATMRATLDETTPGKWVTALQDAVQLPGSGGCGGIPVHYDLGGVKGAKVTVVDMNIGAACSGTMAAAASWFKMGLTAVLIISGSVTCARYLLLSLGAVALSPDGSIMTKVSEGKQ